MNILRIQRTKNGVNSDSQYMYTIFQLIYKGQKWSCLLMI